MIEKSATSRSGRFVIGLLDLNHTESQVVVAAMFGSLSRAAQACGDPGASKALCCASMSVVRRGSMFRRLILIATTLAIGLPSRRRRHASRRGGLASASSRVRRARLHASSTARRSPSTDGTELRLIGALTPRASDAGAEPGTWPAEIAAAAELRALLLGKSVELAFGGERSDRYGRLQAQAYVRCRRRRALGAGPSSRTGAGARVRRCRQPRLRGCPPRRRAWRAGGPPRAVGGGRLSAQGPRTDRRNWRATAAHSSSSKAASPPWRRCAAQST